MKSFFDDFFGNSFGMLFDFPFTEKETNDEDMHSYFHSISEKYKDGKRVSHVEKEVKDGKVLKDVKEEPKLQVIDKPIDLFESCVSPSDEVKKLKEDYAILSNEHAELAKKLDKIEEMYNNVKKENDAFKLGLQNLLSLEK